MERCAVSIALLMTVLVTGPISTPERAAAGSFTGNAPSSYGDVADGERDTLDSRVPDFEAIGIRLGSGELREPLGLAVDIRGFVYAADAMAGKVFRYAADGTSIEFEQPPRSTGLYPIDLAVYGTFVYVLDYTDNRIVRYDSKGAYLDILLSFDEIGRMHPASITVSEGGRMLTTDIENHTVTVWTPLLDIELAVGEYGWSEGKFDRPMKAVILPDDRIAVVETGNRRVQLFSPSGAYEGVFEISRDAQLQSPRSIAADEYGFIYVADTKGGRVIVCSAAGRELRSIEEYEQERISPAAVAVSWNDRLYVADLATRSILVYRIRYPS